MMADLIDRQDVTDTNVGNIDLISRQSAIDAVHYEWDLCLNFDGSGTEIANDTEKALCDVPSAERHGKWLEHKDYPGLAYLCSECNLFTTDRSYYCPHCGALMDEVAQ